MHALVDKVHVSPYIGEWIEIENLHDEITNRLVSPYIGEWIEIVKGKSYNELQAGLTLHR